ncbi:Leucine rich repeat containing protein BspA family protein [Entamoeba marina]
MQSINNKKNCKRVDSYSLLIVTKYFKTQNDFINIICVCKKFKETTEKLRYNPISVSTLKLFPKIQTQYLYHEDDKIIKKPNQIKKYEIWYEMSYEQYLKLKNKITKCRYVSFSRINRIILGKCIPNGITRLGDKCFCNVIGDGYGYKHDVSFIKSISLPSSLILLGDRCFMGCTSLTTINLSTKLRYLPYECFNNCSSLQSINLPFLIQFIDIRCFNNCSSLTSINLPITLQSLPYSCFNHCTSLKSIKIPSSITSLGYDCFSNCSSLTFINIPSTLKTLNNVSFRNCPQLQNFFDNYML